MFESTELVRTKRRLAYYVHPRIVPGLYAPGGARRRPAPPPSYYATSAALAIPLAHLESREPAHSDVFTELGDL